MSHIQELEAFYRNSIAACNAHQDRLQILTAVQGGKNNFGKATQSKFCRVEPTNRWQELNLLKKTLIPWPWLSWRQPETLPNGELH